MHKQIQNIVLQTPYEESEVILSRFPGPVTLYSSRRKWLRLLLFSVVAAAAGLMMVSYGISGGWFFLVVFSALSLLCVGMLLPGASALKLDEEGFEVTKFFRSHRARWRDVKNFQAIEIARNSAILEAGSTEMVVYDDNTSTRGLVAAVNTAFADRNAYLPDTYGIPSGELVRLMGCWRERATGRK